MSTKNLIPRGNEEGKLGIGGSTPRKWLEVNARKGNFNIAAVNALNNLSGFTLLEGGTDINITGYSSETEGFKIKIDYTGSGGGSSNSDPHRIFADNVAGGNISEVLVSDDNTTDGTYINFKINNLDRWRINSEGNFVPFANDANDLGSLTKSVRSIYLKDRDFSGKDFGLNFSNGTSWKSNLSLSSSSRLQVSKNLDSNNNPVFDNIPVFKTPVRLATTEDLVGYSYSNHTLKEDGTTGSLSLDGVSTSTNDRILVKNQTTKLENGIYKVTIENSKVVLVRVDDLPLGDDFSNIIVQVLLGSDHGGSQFTSKSNSTNSHTVGTDNLDWIASSFVGIKSVSEDTNPTLGSHLNVNDFSLKSDATKQISFLPGGITDKGITLDDGLVTVKNNGTSGSELRLYTNSSSGSSHYVSIKAPENPDNTFFVDNGNVTLLLPTHAGANNDTLATQEWIASQNYLATADLSSYVTTTSLSTQLSSYATQTFVTSQGYITNSVSDLTNYYTSTQVDTEINNKIQGFDEVLTPVRLATTDTGTSLDSYIYNNTTLTENGTTGNLSIDGQVVANGDRILVKDRGDDKQNGVYIVSGVGSSSSVVLTRADFTHGSTIDTKFIFVEEGTKHSKNGFVSTAPTAGSVGSVNLVFKQFSSSASITAGGGLTSNGNDFSVNVDGSSIEISTDQLKVKDSGITNAMLAGLIDDSKLNQITTADKISLSALDIDGGTLVNINANPAEVLSDNSLFITDFDGLGKNRKSTLLSLKDYITGGSNNNVSNWKLGSTDGGDVYLDTTNSSDVKLMIAEGVVGATHIAGNAITHSELDVTAITGQTNFTFSTTPSALAEQRANSSILISNTVNDTTTLKKVSVSSLLSNITAEVDINGKDLFPTTGVDRFIDSTNDHLLMYDHSQTKNVKVPLSKIIEAAASSLKFETIYHSAQSTSNRGVVSGTPSDPTDPNKGWEFASNSYNTIKMEYGSTNNTEMNTQTKWFNLPSNSNAGDVIIITVEGRVHPNMREFNIDGSTNGDSLVYQRGEVGGNLVLRNNQGNVDLVRYSMNEINENSLTLTYDGTNWKYPSRVKNSHLRVVTDEGIMLGRYASSSGGGGNAKSLWNKTILFIGKQSNIRTIDLPDKADNLWSGANEDYFGTLDKDGCMKIISWGKNQTFKFTSRSATILDHNNLDTEDDNLKLTDSLVITPGPGIIEVRMLRPEEIVNSNWSWNNHCWLISYPKAVVTQQDIIDLLEGGIADNSEGVFKITKSSPVKFESAKITTGMLKTKLLDDANSTVAAISQANISDSAVGPSEIADNAVQTSKIKNENVTFEKLSKLAPFKIMGNIDDSRTDANNTEHNVSPTSVTVDIDLTAENVGEENNSVSTTKAIKEYVNDKFSSFVVEAASSSYKYLNLTESSPPGEILTVSQGDFVGDTAHIVVKNGRYRRSINFDQLDPSTAVASKIWANEKPGLMSRRIRDNLQIGTIPNIYPAGYQLFQGVEMPRASSLPIGSKVIFYYISTINPSLLPSQIPESGDYWHVPANLRIFVNRNDKVYMPTATTPGNKGYPGWNGAGTSWNGYHYNAHNPEFTEANMWSGLGSSSNRKYRAYNEKYQVDFSNTSSIYNPSSSEKVNMINVYNDINGILSWGTLKIRSIFERRLIPKGFRDFTQVFTEDHHEAVYVAYQNIISNLNPKGHQLNYHTGVTSNIGNRYDQISYLTQNNTYAQFESFPSKAEQDTHCTKAMFTLVRHSQFGLVWQPSNAGNQVIEIPVGIS